MTDGRAIEVYAHSGEGYEALLDFESWRIGYMRRNTWRKTLNAFSGTRGATRRLCC